MVGANGGGSFLVPWLIFLFVWSVPLVIAEFAIGREQEQVLLVHFVFLQVNVLHGWDCGLLGFPLPLVSIML